MSIKEFIKTPEKFLTESQMKELYKNLTTFLNKSMPLPTKTGKYVFTDGACSGNGKKNGKTIAGWGVFFGDFDPRNSYGKITGSKITNNVAELTAIHSALKIIKKTGESFIIVSDSQYSINSISKWAKGWEKNGWKKKGNKEILNLDLIKKSYKLYLETGVKFQHVNSHQKEPKQGTPEHELWYGNDQADELATKGSKL